MTTPPRTPPTVEGEVPVTWATVSARIDATVLAVLLVVAMFVPWLVGPENELAGVADLDVVGGSAVVAAGGLLIVLLLSTAARPSALLEVVSAAIGVIVALLAQQVAYDRRFGTGQTTGIDDVLTAVLLVYAARVGLRSLRRASVPGRFRWMD